MDQRTDLQIDLAREEIRDLTASLVDPTAEEPFGVYVWPSDHPGAELGRYLERKVFGEFFGNDDDVLAAEYSEYEPASLFFTVVDHRRNLPAGVIRVIVPSERGFKSLDDIERVWQQRVGDVLTSTGVEMDADGVWDVATLAVDADYRGGATQGLVSLALYGAVCTTAVRVDVEWLVTVLDVVVLDLIQSQIQKPFAYYRGVGPLRYLDSPSSVPVWCDMGAWKARVSAADPTMHDLIFDGRGLEATMRAPDWDALAEMVRGRVAIGR